MVVTPPRKSGRDWHLTGLGGFDARSLPPIRWTGQQTTADDRQLIVAKLASVLADERPTHKVSAMFIDSAFGAVIVSRLKQLGYHNVFEVNFGGAALDVHEANMRAYMWRSVKDWLVHGAIDATDQRLIDDLEGPGYHLNPKQQLVLEAKESMQRRGVASPDDGDALALTFAAPVKPKAVVHRQPPTDGGPVAWTRG